MSKRIKQLEMDALKKTFQGVQDMVLLSSTGVKCQTDNQMRLGLRKKNIRLQVIKNSLARRVFEEIGIKLANCWEGSTTVAWGAGSIAELSRELDALIKKNDKIKVKTAVAEGQEIPFQKALQMPTRVEAIGKVIALALSPASRILAQLTSPGSRIVGQIKSLGEKKEEEKSVPAVATL
jgi:large subunit ribosomal protein L10